MPLKVSSDLNHLDLKIAHESSAFPKYFVLRGESFLFFNSMVASFVLLNEKILHNNATLQDPTPKDVFFGGEVCQNDFDLFIERCKICRCISCLWSCPGSVHDE